MYQNIIDAINQCIENYKNNDDIGGSDKDKHYFIEGLKVAKQIVEQVRETDIEMAYETFENVVMTLKNELDRYDMEVIIEDVFMDED
jgi:hypothetical protein